MTNTDNREQCRCFYLDGVEAADDSSVLDLDMRRRMSKAALVVGARASSTYVFAADFQREPSRVLSTATISSRH